MTIEPGETYVLLDHRGPGCITHLYCGMIMPDLREYRSAVLRCYWDESPTPSVEVPLGDFFGLAHGRVREVSSHLVTVNGGCGSSHGLNAYFPMPFSSAAVVTLENRGSSPLGGLFNAFWYHVDYETYDRPIPEDVQRFHACFRHEHPTKAVGQTENMTIHDAVNISGEENYVALDTVGNGRMVGLILEIENVQGETWYGEGDDMVYIDGEEWPPSIHGTGTEEIFGGGASPTGEYSSPYTGFHLVESNRYDGLVAMYRWYVNDPIHFDKSLRWTIEHGHANNFSNNYASVAFWYQLPLAALPPLPQPKTLEPPLPADYETALGLLNELARKYLDVREDPAVAMSVFQEVCGAGASFYRGDFETFFTEATHQV